MPKIDIINKEVDETIGNISHQHQEIKYYFQLYTVALIGLFSISGYFSNNGLSIHESIIGSAYTVTVFFLGWVFLSIVSHKVAMIILLYKHIAIFRRRRLNILKGTNLMKDYVLPSDKKDVMMPEMLKYLPYLVFVFNFLILCGGLAFYFAPHMPYYQMMATVTATAVLFGAFYPRVCITFNKHVSCATRGSTLRAKYRMELAWERAIKQAGKPSRIIKIIFLIVSALGAWSIAVVSFFIENHTYQVVIVFFCWGGITMFGILRYKVEIYNFKIAQNKISEIA